MTILRPKLKLQLVGADGNTGIRAGREKSTSTRLAEPLRTEGHAGGGAGGVSRVRRR